MFNLNSNQFAFFENTLLISVTLPTSLAQISFGAFQQCTSLTVVVIPT